MAEVVGLVSAIAALATLGFKLANGISVVADELVTATPQLRAIATDTRTIALILHELRSHLKRANGLTQQAVRTAQEIIAQCQIDIQDLHDCMQPLFKGRGENGKIELGWMRRVRWLFAKSKIATRRASLDSLKLTLNMYICSLGFMGEEDVEDYIEDEVYRMVLQCKKTKSVFLQAGRHDIMVEMAYDAYKKGSTALELQDHIPNDCSMMISSKNTQRDKLVLAVVGVGDQASDETYWPEHHVQIQGFQATDSQMIEDISDDQFIKIGEHMRVQKITSNFALDLVDQRDTIPSSEAPLLPAFNHRKTPQLAERPMSIVESTKAPSVALRDNLQGSGMEYRTASVDHRGKNLNPNLQSTITNTSKIDESDRLLDSHIPSDSPIKDHPGMLSHQESTILTPNRSTRATTGASADIRSQERGTSSASTDVPDKHLSNATFGYASRRHSGDIPSQAPRHRSDFSLSRLSMDGSNSSMDWSTSSIDVSNLRYDPADQPQTTYLLTAEDEARFQAATSEVTRMNARRLTLQILTGETEEGDMEFEEKSRTLMKKVREDAIAEHEANKMSKRSGELVPLRPQV